MLCLQTTLVPYATTKITACSALKDTAFASHPRCYVDSGSVFFKSKDWLVIVETVRLKDLFGGINNVKAVFETVGNGAEFYAWLIEQSIIKFVDEAKEEAKDIWHESTSWLQGGEMGKGRELKRWERGLKSSLEVSLG